MPADDARVGRLEQDVAVLKQRSDDHEGDIRAFGPLVTEHAVLTERLAGLQHGLNNTRKTVQDLAHTQERHRELIDQRIEADQERDRGARRYRITTYISFAGLLMAFAGIIIAVLTFISGSPG
jgi:hypothetical protein